MPVNPGARSVVTRIEQTRKPPMPRRTRISLAGLPLHLIQRGNNRSECFFAVEDFRAYLHWLRRYAEGFGVRLHAYVLMTNHVHLLLTPERPEQACPRRRTCGVHAEDYLLSCMRYIELNPVRAGLTASPELYRWSSYRHNGQGVDDPLLGEHALYAALGCDAAALQAAYRELFRGQLDEATVAEIRAATNKGHLLAAEGIRRQAEASLRPLGPAPRGRPPRKKNRL